MIKKISFLVLFVFIFTQNTSLAYDKEFTHRELSKIAAENSIIGNYLEDLGFKSGLKEVFLNKPVREWIKDGSEFEDDGLNFLNHFHNPLKQWPEAGLNDLLFSGESSLLWAQEGTNEFSWQSARQYFYEALTGSTKSVRESSFSKTFEGLGHLIHLVQDAAQPAHVRNDAHPADALGISPGLEDWAKKNPGEILSYASSPRFPTVDLNPSIGVYEPVTQFFDTDQYTGAAPSISTAQGLAEYTNANFLSDDTIFTENLDRGDNHYFPFPRKEDMEEYDEDIGNGEMRTYFRKTGGESIDHFAVAGRLYQYLSFWPSVQRYFISLDDRSHQEYAKKLIPRAVGYSTALIDYFFRGNLEVTNIGEYTNKFTIKNISSESMDGTFALYYDAEDGLRNQVPGALWTFSLNTGETSGLLNYSTPAGVNESTKYILVFRGILGGESDAVLAKILSAKSGRELVFVKMSENGMVTMWTVFDPQINSVPVIEDPEFDDGRKMVFPATNEKIQALLDGTISSQKGDLYSFNYAGESEMSDYAESVIDLSLNTGCGELYNIYTTDTQNNNFSCEGPNGSYSKRIKYETLDMAARISGSHNVLGEARMESWNLSINNNSGGTTCLRTTLDFDYFYEYQSDYCPDDGDAFSNLYRTMKHDTVTPIGNLGEIVEVLDLQQSKDLSDNWQYDIYSKTEFRRGGFNWLSMEAIYSDTTMVQVFALHALVDESDTEIVYSTERIEQLVAACNDYNDANLENPISQPTNGSFENSIRDLINSFYLVNGIGYEEMPIIMSDPIRLDIRGYKKKKQRYFLSSSTFHS